MGYVCAQFIIHYLSQWTLPTALLYAIEHVLPIVLHITFGFYSILLLLWQKINPTVKL